MVQVLSEVSVVSKTRARDVILLTKDDPTEYNYEVSSPIFSVRHKKVLDPAQY